MLSQEKVARINELAKRAKTTGLTSDELNEQKKLREEYIQTFRSNFTDQLHSIKVVDKKGRDVTPKKLKESKKGKNRPKH